MAKKTVIPKVHPYDRVRMQEGVHREPKKMLVQKIKESYYHFWCPGCNNIHALNERWELTGTLEQPTFTPSVRTWRKEGDGQEVTICHLYVTEGRIAYLADCKHKFAGQTIPMEFIPKMYLVKIKK